MTKINFNQTLRFNIDAEFVPKNSSSKFIHLNSTYYATDLCTIQVRDDKTPLGEGIIYSHPESHPEAKKHYKTFESPLVIFDYLKDMGKGYLVDENPTQRMKKVLFQIFFFYSPKDIESSINKKVRFKDGSEVGIHELYLNCFSKTRRIRTQIKKGKNISPYIPTNHVLNIDGENHVVYHEYIDISGLSNCGLAETSEIYLGKMDFKDNLTLKEKSNIVEAKLLGTKRFEDYALGDLNMTEIFDASVVLENNLRSELDLPLIKASQKKLTIGAMAARLLRDYIKKYLDADEITLNNFSVYCSPNSIQRWLAPYIKKEQLNRLPYTGMVDGGRCVRELSQHPYFESYSIDVKGNSKPDFTKILKFLVDIDIDGCYGNGLKNQKFALGNPSIDTNTYTLREFLKKYKKHLVNGLWGARLFGSFEDSNFSQDLIISKTRDSVRAYENKLSQSVASDNSEVSELLNALTSNMCCLTKEIHGGEINSDVLEIILNHTSNQEKSYWLDNIQVTGFTGYLSINRVNSIEEMLEDGHAKCDVDLKKSITNTSINNKWIEIPLDEYADKLLKLRKKYPKKTPMNNFLKLVINATYGVICSQYFDTDDTGISNVVIANNITARARVLAWCMSKALRTAMSITDGGVFDLNQVVFSKVKKSTLTQFCNLSNDIFSKSSRHTLFELKPLLDKQINISDYADESKADELSELIKTIDNKAWEHCANMFPELSIFKENQFSFESKNVYTDLTLHNKSDYILENKIFNFYKKDKQYFLKVEPFILWRQRGTKGDEGKQESKKLYQAIKEDKAIMIEFKQDSLIGLNEYQKCFKNVNITENELLSYDDWDEIPLEAYSTLGQKLLKNNVFPGDVKEMKRYLFSHIPTCMKHTTLTEYEKSRDIAEEMRKTQNPQLGKDRMNDLGWL